MAALCSDDIMAHFQRQKNCVRLSLYTASHLLYGTVVVFHKQQHYLIGLLHTVHDMSDEFTDTTKLVLYHVVCM